MFNWQQKNNNNQHGLHIDPTKQAKCVSCLRSVSVQCELASTWTRTEMYYVQNEMYRNCPKHVLEQK